MMLNTNKVNQTIESELGLNVPIIKAEIKETIHSIELQLFKLRVCIDTLHNDEIIDDYLNERMKGVERAVGGLTKEIECSIANQS